MNSIRLVYFLFVFLISQTCAAGSISFVGACDKVPILSLNFSLLQPTTVGALTLQILEQNKIPYEGAERGFHSMFGTPTGLEALEFLSKDEMRAYGWCYSINGVQPKKYPDQVQVSSLDHVVWWFAYAHYKKGEWISQCEHSSLLRPDFLCKKN